MTTEGLGICACAVNADVENPVAVFYSTGHKAFFCRRCLRGMGLVFYKRWSPARKDLKFSPEVWPCPEWDNAEDAWPALPVGGPAVTDEKTRPTRTCLTSDIRPQKRLRAQSDHRITIVVRDVKLDSFITRSVEGESFRAEVEVECEEGIFRETFLSERELRIYLRGIDVGAFPQEVDIPARWRS